MKHDIFGGSAGIVKLAGADEYKLRLVGLPLRNARTDEDRLAWRDGQLCIVRYDREERLLHGQGVSSAVCRRKLRAVVHPFRRRDDLRVQLKIDDLSVVGHRRSHLKNRADFAHRERLRLDHGETVFARAHPIVAAARSVRTHLHVIVRRIDVFRDIFENNLIAGTRRRPADLVLHEIAPRDKAALELARGNGVELGKVIATFLERMSSGLSDMKGFGASTVKSEVIAKESDEEREWKEFFARCSGVTWPVGSSCTYVKQIGKLRVRNTPENLKLIDEFMDEVKARGVLLEVQTRFVRVAQKTLDEIGAELFPGKGAGYRYDLVEFDAVPAGELERRLASRRDLVENKVCRVTTHPGEEAVFKNVSECIYPTDFDVQMSSYAPSGSNDWVRTGEYGFATVEPQSFTGDSDDDRRRTGYRPRAERAGHCAA